MENFEVDLSEDDENFSNKDGTEVTQESLDEIKQNYSFIENLFSIKRAFQKKDKDGFRKIVFFCTSCTKPISTSERSISNLSRHTFSKHREKDR